VYRTGFIVTVRPPRSCWIRQNQAALIDGGATPSASAAPVLRVSLEQVGAIGVITIKQVDHYPSVRVYINQSECLGRLRRPMR